jgi:protocatechuate 3,4-dioxygenase beta subunit
MPRPIHRSRSLRALELLETRTLLASNAIAPIAAQATALAAAVRAAQTAVVPTVSVSDVSVTEGTRGRVTTATIPVTLSEAASRPVRIAFRTQADTATGTGSARDFLPARGVLTIRRGATTGQIRVRVRGDSTAEADEVFNVVLTRAVNATLQTGSSGSQSARVVILDDDSSSTTPTIAVTGFTKTEGNDDTTTANFTVTLSAASASTVTVGFATVNGTATAGLDYQAASGTLTFAPGETSKVVTVTILNDTAAESSETLTLNLNNPTNATISSVAGSAVGTIVDDDSTSATPAIIITGFSTTEGNSGTKTANFNVTLSAASASAITVAYATANGSATAGSDYQAASGTLTFAVGETSKVVTVTILGDTTVESTETLTLNLSNPTGATLSASAAVGTIVDDDGTTTTTLTPAVTEGPYFNEYSDASLNRSDLKTGTTRTSVINAVPLALTFNVFQVSGTTVTPLSGARLDLWHTDAIGKYSDEASEGTSGQTFLRGYQFTDANGSLTFNTIIPGWYSGRTPHIHFMVRSVAASGALTNRVTSQLFFDPTVINTIYTTNAAYSARGTPDTTNAADMVYNTRTTSGGIAGPSLLLSLAPNGTGGYTATFNVYVAAS